MALPLKLSELFAQDVGNPAQPLKTFYLSATHKLTAFFVGVLALESSLVMASDSWKDDFVHGVFTSLSVLATVVGAGTSVFFGAGAIIPLVACPLISAGGYLFDQYREHKKAGEAENAGAYFQSEPEQVFHQIQSLAYGLTYLLQQQLPHCTQEGSQAIVDAWLYRLSYQIMKHHKPNTTEDEVGRLVSSLLNMGQGKNTKHGIHTHNDLKWNTVSLF